MPRVLNLRDGKTPRSSPTSVCIDRRTKWGNPFVIGLDEDRASVVAHHEEWIADQTELLAQLDELRGKDLVCWCAPLACHGDVLLRLANPDEELGQFE